MSSKKRQWLYGDESPACKRPLLLDSSSDQALLKAGNCGAAYLHSDAWSYIIQLLRWEDITMLLRTGDVTMRRRVARAARHAKIRFCRDGVSPSQYSDIAFLGLLKDTSPEGLNLTSLNVTIGKVLDLKTTAHIVSHLHRLEKFSLSIEFWHNDVTRFLEGESAMNLRTLFDTSMLRWDAGNDGKLRTGEPLIQLPSSIKSVSLDMPESCKPNHIISLEKCHSLSELRILGVETDFNTSLPLLTHEIGLIPINITSLHLPGIGVPQLVYERFRSLTSLQISLTNMMVGALHAALPPSLRRIVFMVLSDHIGVDHIAQYFVSADKSRLVHLPSLAHIAFVCKGNYRIRAEMHTIDLLTVLSRSTPALETIEDRQRIINLDSYRMKEDVLRDAISAVSRLPLLREVPLSFFGGLFSDFDTVVTEAGRISTLCAVSCSPSPDIIFYRSCKSHESRMPLIKATHLDVHTAVETPTLFGIPNSLSSVFQLSASMLQSISFDDFFEVSAPLSCLKSLPLLKRLCVTVARSSKSGGGLACQDNADELYHWCRASLPVSLESLVLGYADSPKSMANWKKVDNESHLCSRRIWFPPQLERLEVSHIFPDRTFASALPLGLVHLNIKGRWSIAPDQLHLLDDIGMMQASDFFEYMVGPERWFKYGSMNVSFVGDAWESILKDFVYQFTGYVTWQNAVRKRLKLVYLDRAKRRLPGREAQETIYTVSI